MQIQRLDHLVLTVADIEATCDFYTQVLGFRIISWNGRYALQIGESPQKINLHAAGQPFQPAAQRPQIGSADLCFLTDTPLAAVIEHFDRLAVPIVTGPVQRTGTLGPILSVYVRDPDGNLIEVANALDANPR
jgi:catechol 2,3-dioxygenase-like lactoylglutathione lyase family enzyme